MNRTILFRGKRVDNGEWVEGDYLSCQKEIVILNYTKKDNLYTLYFENHAVIPDTVSQFSGLKDKNGVMIWENDIINLKTFEGYRNYQVVWQDTGFSLYSKLQNYYYELTKKDVQNCEVIGNVFDKRGE